MDTSTALPLLDETLLATTRYLQALTGLDDDSVRRPSLLPDWSRAHVVAHVSRNADAFARVILSVLDGEPATMYDAPGSRDLDITETARLRDCAQLVTDARESSRRLERAWRACDADPTSPYARLPDQAETFPLSTVGRRRRAEVEIHHVDLDVGYSPADWPADFAQALVGQRHQELGQLGADCPSMVLSSTDAEGLWKLGPGQGPEIHGTTGDLAWWLVGRGTGGGLSCSAGALPVLGRWR